MEDGPVSRQVIPFGSFDARVAGLGQCVLFSISTCFIFFTVLTCLGATPSPSDAPSPSTGKPLEIRGLHSVLKGPSFDRLFHKRDNPREDDTYYTCEAIVLNMKTTNTLLGGLKELRTSEVLTISQAAEANGKIDGLFSIVRFS
ncbi:hypothetical protein PGT21_032722 [Puccinia graminis f. sp. tritici]|uniref:Uncharacterized protein n=1 Tax=Puccinia graminis f. sp. tritici TaxID=56615 RepID=A0A5B0QK34_PUCGR|nr:hypothetical protein PGT21_032722 [Puccinia graminis f. sp. tritici]KAA1130817.1 hypothetical protein PGTUg99_023512 [Puccinia graminis f. sp. tritici]